MNSATFPAEHIGFQLLAEAAFHQWTPTASVSYKRLKNGNSGAVVLKVDVRNNADHGLASGQYILKLSRPSLWKDQATETVAHERAEKRARDFAARHIPKMVRSFALPDSDPGTSGYAMLYEIAGLSLDRHVTVDSRMEDGFFGVSELISRDLLQNWVAPEPTEDRTPASLLAEWLAYRIDLKENPALFEYVKSVMGTEIASLVAGEAIVNPIEFYGLAQREQWQERACLSGLLHGDLHGGNILVSRQDPATEPYWIIDFGLSREGPAGYDHAYLEVAQLLAKLPTYDPTVLFSLLVQLKGEESTQTMPPGTGWLLGCLSRMRKAIAQWQQNSQSRRMDDVFRQFMLARIAAGLNWANKPIPKEQRSVALYYSGWHAREFLKEFEPETWGKITQASEMVRVASAASSPKSSIEDQLWTQLLALVDDFSTRTNRFVLVAEGLGAQTELEAMGQLPWSAVIDFDPDSDVNGLHRHAAPVLQRKRGLHTFSNSKGIDVNFARGTAWMMASGWNLKREVIADFDDWTYNSLPQIRSLIEMINRSVSPDPLHVIVVPGATMDPDMPLERVARISREFIELTRGRTQVILLGSGSFPVKVRHTHIPLSVGSFLHRLATTLGRSLRSEAPRIPAADGEEKLIPLDSLRTMEENFTVVHSAVLEDVHGETSTPGGFWRGNPPSWSDLQQDLDVKRNITDALEMELRDRLEESRNYTVVMYHHPGAGGTTAALRVAWNLREEFPVAILRKYSDALAARVEALFHLAQKPVLLVAESSDLTESHREDLYRDLSRRNARAVLLYIRRAFRAVQEEHAYRIFDPMTPSDAGEFLKTYSTQTNDPERLKQLRQITELPDFEDYRRAFFYGLITFDRDFKGIADYVKDHIRGLRGKPRDLLAYISLITIYSNQGLHEVFARRLRGISDNSSIDLDDLLGEGPARLITQRTGRQLRILHQFLAEEVLNTLDGGSGDDWKLTLKDLADDLIRDLVRVGGGESENVSELFRQLFVQRDAGGWDGTEDRGDFSALIDDLDQYDRGFGQQIFETLTEQCPQEAHFWNHRGRHQIYRLKRQPERAEDYLIRAVNLAADDYVHYHTLGLVRRSRVKEQLRLMKGKTAEEILLGIDPLFKSAAEAFEKTRSINPENVYGHITHVQMILEVAHRLRESAGIENLGQIGQVSAQVSRWIEENVSLAEQLLDDARQLYGVLAPDNSYLTNCVAELKRLYGNLDQVISLWEISNARGRGDMHSRRALAHAYFERESAERTSMTISVRRRIVDLMEQNLRSSARREDDFRLWFEAYRGLSEFEIDDAIVKLRMWSERFPSWRAQYYLYVLHFLLWFDGKANLLYEMEEALERCKQEAIGKRTTSYLWLGFGSASCPLLSDIELGKWQTRKGKNERSFWKDPARLRPINGVIEAITGPQSGEIKIDGRVSAFFPPGTDFRANEHENKPVHFYLGFSPSGLRAWLVEREHVTGGDRVTTFVPRRPTEAAVTAPFDQEIAKRQLQRLQTERIETFVRDFLLAKSEIDADVLLSELQARVQAVLQVDIEVELQEILKNVLEKDKLYLRSASGDDQLVRAGNSQKQRSTFPRSYGVIVKYQPVEQYGFIKGWDDVEFYFRKNWVQEKFRKRLSRDQLVSFTVSTSDRGPVAIGIALLDPDTTWTQEGILLKKELTSRVANYAMRLLEETLSGDEGIDLSEFSRELNRTFRGVQPLPARLDVDSFSEFLNRLPGIKVYGVYPNLKVKLESAFGRVQPSKARWNDQKPKPVTVLTTSASRIPTLDQAQAEIISFLSTRGGTSRLADVGHKLSQHFKGVKLVKEFKCKSMAHLIKKMEKVILETRGDVHWVRLAEMPATNEDVKPTKKSRKAAVRRIHRKPLYGWALKPKSRRDSIEPDQD